MKDSKIILLTLLAMLGSCLWAQSDKTLSRRGIRDLKHGNNSEAEVMFKKSLEQSPTNPVANYNLGEALYNQNSFEDAEGYFSTVTQLNTSKKVEADALYNLGNTYVNEEKYAEAVDAYKKVLKLNPDDEDARYNLEYARLKLAEMQKQQGQQQQQDQQEQQEQDGQQQQQDQQQQDQQQDQQQSQQQEQQDQQQQEGQQQQMQQQDQMSKEDAERMLQALQEQEKKTMDKVNEQKFQTSPKRKSLKDW